MPKPTTHVLMVVDRSGSMLSLADDVRGGFNQYLDDLAKDDARYRLTVTLFNTEYTQLGVAAKLKDVPKLNTANYKPGGMTALLDAVGKTIAEFEARVPELSDGDRVLLVVQTDGAENSSREFTRDQIAELIRAREAGGKWTCLFLGAGIDAWAHAGGLGFQQGNTVAVAHSAAGTQSSYSTVSGITRSYAAGASAADVSQQLAEAADPSGASA